MASEFKWLKTMSKIQSDVGLTKAFDIAVAESAARYMNPFVPMRDGFLSQNYETGADLDGGFVKYTSPYAHRQYNGTDFNFSKEQHPLATHHWDKAMLVSTGPMFFTEINLLRKVFAK